MTTPSPLEQKIPVAIRNEFFYAFARLCMIAALPLIGFLGTRLIAKADEISDQVARQGVTIQLLSNDVKFRFDNITDHEQRIRALERK